MLFAESPAELTTGATDAVLAVECAVIMARLRSAGCADAWRVGLWRWVFGLLAIASFLGALAHSFKMAEAVRAALWKPLHLSLGMLVALFVVGAIADWRGWTAAKPLLCWSIGVGAAFFGLTEFLGWAFLNFIIYEAVALVSALGIYTFLAATNRLRGAGVVALAILLNLTAAGAQASNVSLHLLLPFDHNGVFHLVQMVSTAVLGLGLSLGMSAGQRRLPSFQDALGVQEHKPISLEQVERIKD